MVQPAPAAQPGAGDAWSTGRPRWWRVAAVVIAVAVLLPSLLIRLLLAPPGPRSDLLRFKECSGAGAHNRRRAALSRLQRPA
ncbi:hypothetical protein [Synechococcus sp. RedBA-s]|uniref:hypothetical protein n=1 Tax=Synechococcus sp. RedBA-s TaxID=2823741 RepID=UPI0020CF1BA5|nr:hypothetical protein [Synechococcus sp. RedBA-s]